MSSFRPKFITFDCYGTLIYFEMAPAARRAYAGRLSPEQMDAFCDAFASYRSTRSSAPWKPYQDVVRNAVERTCKLPALPLIRPTPRPLSTRSRAGARIPTCRPASPRSPRNFRSSSSPTR
jgi:hypothetical protein